MDLLAAGGKMPYPALQKRFTAKPAFTNIARSMEGYCQQVLASASFGRLFYFNLGVLSVLCLGGAIRLATGWLRHKPVAQIAIVLLLFLIITTIFLVRLTSLLFTTIIPAYYKQVVLPASSPEASWQWQYFLPGMAVFTTSFLPLINSSDRQRTGADASTGASDSWSCGSGSSCVSCGGGD